MSLVLVTAQGISNNYFKLGVEELQSSKNEMPPIIYKITLRTAYIELPLKLKDVNGICLGKV
ncbi:MAG TPA: hypothetical protein VIP56_02690 [Nitrososphaeraceae archaeon]